MPLRVALWALVPLGLALLLAACGGRGEGPTAGPARLPLTDPRAVPTAEPWAQPPPVRYIGAPSAGAERQGGGREEAAGACGDVYVVQPGDTLSGIAVRCGVDLQDILEANPQIEDPTSIFPGQEIRIPR